jgi:hypothetical protein
VATQVETTALDGLNGAAAVDPALMSQAEADVLLEPPEVFTITDKKTTTRKRRRGLRSEVRNVW